MRHHWTPRNRSNLSVGSPKRPSEPMCATPRGARMEHAVLLAEDLADRAVAAKLLGDLDGALVAHAEHAALAVVDEG